MDRSHRAHLLSPGAPALAVLALACGPGGFASDGSSFGDDGTSTLGAEPGDDDASTSSASESLTDTADATDSAETTETTETDDTADTSDSWTDPETETETGEPPSDQPLCTRGWTHIDASESHGHIGTTPIAGRPDGGFVSVNPIIGQGGDPVNVDARFRSWSPDGALEWDELISWAEHRDDPLALVYGPLGQLFFGGRTNANTLIEDAMIAALDGDSGEVLWSYLRLEGGGYGSILHNGAVVVAAGAIGELGAHALELVALDPDTGELVWSTTAQLPFTNIETRGMVMAGGVIDVLVAESSGAGEVQLLRFSPPQEQHELLTSLADGVELASFDLERLGPDTLAALYGVGTSSYLALIDRDDGQLQATIALDDYGLATTVSATELAVTPWGLAIAGTAWDVETEAEVFVMHLDAELEPICVGRLAKIDLDGINHPLELRGLAVGPEGRLITGSYVRSQRLSVFSHWDSS